MQYFRVKVFPISVFIFPFFVELLCVYFIYHTRNPRKGDCPNIFHSFCALNMGKMISLIYNNSLNLFFRKHQLLLHLSQRYLQKQTILDSDVVLLNTISKLLKFRSTGLFREEQNVLRIVTRRIKNVASQTQLQIFQLQILPLNQSIFNIRIRLFLFSLLLTFLQFAIMKQNLDQNLVVYIHSTYVLNNCSWMDSDHSITIAQRHYLAQHCL